MSQPVSPPPASGNVKDIDAKLLANWQQSIRAPASTVAPPLTSGSVGTPGQIAYDQNFAYICVGVNLWKRIPLLAF